MILSVRQFFGGLNAFLYLQLRIMWLWSMIYRAIHLRPFREVRLSTFVDIADIPVFCRNGKLWVADGWRQLWDVVPSPEYAQAVFSNLTPPPTSGFDCSALAQYQTAVVEKSLADGVMKSAVSKPRFFCVNWWEGSTFRGHNVCMVELPPFAPGAAPRFAYFDNWNVNPSKGSLEELAEQVREKNLSAGVLSSDVKPVLFAVLTSKLELELIVRGQ